MPFDVSAPDSGRSTPILIVPLLAVPPPPAVPHAASTTLARANPASNFDNLIQRPPSNLVVLGVSSSRELPVPERSYIYNLAQLGATRRARLLIPTNNVWGLPQASTAA